MGRRVPGTWAQIHQPPILPLRHNTSPLVTAADDGGGARLGTSRPVSRSMTTQLILDLISIRTRHVASHTAHTPTR